MSAYIEASKKFRNDELTAALKAINAAGLKGIRRSLARTKAHAKHKARQIGNKAYVARKLTPFNYNKSMKWKAHVAKLKNAQNAALAIVMNLQAKKANKAALIEAVSRFMNAKKAANNARKSKTISLGNQVYTKAGKIFTGSSTTMNNKLKYLAFIALTNPNALRNEFRNMYPFKANNRRTVITTLANIEGNRNLPRNVRMAARRRAIDLGREATYYNQEKARQNAEEKKKQVAKAWTQRQANQAELKMRLLKEEANNRAKKAKQNANARRAAYRPPTKRGLNTIKENNNNNLKSPPINNPLFKPNNVAYPLPRPKPNNSNSNNNYYNTIENFPENVNARATKRAANLLFNEAARKREAAIAKMTAANAARATLERKLANQAAANAKAAEKAAAAVNAQNKAAKAAAKVAEEVKRSTLVKTMVSGAIGKVLGRRYVQLLGQAGPKPASGPTRGNLIKRQVPPPSILKKISKYQNAGGPPIAPVTNFSGRRINTP